MKWFDRVILIKFNQFFIFLSWLTFGRAAVNPFGSDDTDIDIKHLLVTHVQVILWIVLRFLKSYL